MSFPVPSNEDQRQKALCALGILDTPADAFFDDVVTLAARLTKAPISAVSLVDRDRQWFKAITGLDVRETPREVSFCAHAICSPQILTVPDATKDIRFAETSLVIGEPRIRSYVGAPLIDKDGCAIGVLCAIDQSPRDWSADDHAVLASLAQMAIRHIETQAMARRTQEVEALHDGVVSAMAEGVVVQSATGEVRLANPAALSILGLTLDQITGKTSLDPGWKSLHEDGTPFLGEDHPAMVCLRTGKAVDGVVMNVARPDGARKWIKINARPIFATGSAASVEVVATFSDITEQREAHAKLQSKKQRLDMALELGAIGVIERDTAAGDVRIFGHAATIEKFGPVIGSEEGSLLDRVPADRQTEISARWANHMAGGPRLRLETPIVIGDGSQRWALVGAEKLQDAHGRVTGALVALKDIDDRKQAEFAVIDSLQKLEVASRAKDAFLANIGHEIRTPLNGVIGMASALGLTSMTQEQHEMARLIISSGEVLDRLLSDLLDMSKLQAGKLAIESSSFDLCAAVVEASQLFEIRAHEKGIRFSLDLAREAYGSWVGDKVRIKQIVHNLVSNAIKFTAKGEVQVHLFATGAPGAHGPDWVTLKVEDTGIGIEEDFQDQIFDRFEQVRTQASAPAGTGLGLSICKSLVGLMGGEITVASRPLLGSTFTVRLPMDRATDAEPEGTEGEPAKGKLMRVLLVDDHTTNQKVVEAMLRAFDCEIVTANDGAEGVAAFQAGPFDLVLMDMSMPVMDGVTATRGIRSHERQTGMRRTPLAMLTAYASDQHKREAQEAGADFHIVKPVTPVSLLAGLEKAIRASKAADAA